MKGYSKVIGYFIVGGIIVLAVFMFAVKPALEKVATQSETEKTARTELAVLDQQILAYKTAKSDLSKALERDLLNEYIVNETDLRVPIEEMEASAQRTGTRYELKINKVYADDPVDTKKANSSALPSSISEMSELVEVPYTLTVSNSSYSSLMNFVSYLENIPHFTEFSEIELYTEDSELNTGSVIGSIKGSFLIRKEMANEN